jgi:arylsulfatase A-like enzyme
MLKAAGYQTVGIVTNENLVPAFGFDRGFDDYIVRLKAPAAEVNELAFEWLEQNSSAQPFFLYLHTMEPHAAYAPVEPFRSQFEPRADEMPTWTPRWKWPVELVPFFSNLYDGEIAANDVEFGDLIDRLRELDLYGESLIIMTSDHGEEFREHGKWRHGFNLHAETLNIPLIIKYPDQAVGRRHESTVQHIDLMPTILDYAGVKVPEAMQGNSLQGLDREESSPRNSPSPPIFSHLRLSRSPLYTSVIDGDWKFIRGERSGVAISSQLFNWRTDPDEKMDLQEGFPIRKQLLEVMVQEKWSAEGEVKSAPEIILDEKMQQGLRDLGYLQ